MWVAYVWLSGREALFSTPGPWSYVLRSIWMWIVLIILLTILSNNAIGSVLLAILVVDLETVNIIIVDGPVSIPYLLRDWTEITTIHRLAI